ncbi:S9 family peptidase [Sandaracinobacteroides saxicola]|uniref:S9 family peptidase n=2 Tax=Sandaracinobacteroides saxicola TaxID=2759707 RepID=A0A7G5IMS4_9SPHN|nr:S9 family peptidase [Sandaracinobacteroides saxicola]QMW24666.1 S9 family peptidase [Sandaracinobacteroides saxicola]
MPIKGPPVARATDFSFTLHGTVVKDPYKWLKDEGYPKVDDAEVLAYLNAENAWFEQEMKPQSMLVEALFEQMKARIKEDDASVPYPDGDWAYFNRFDPAMKGGSQYRNWYRMPRNGGPETLILSEPALADGKKYFRLGAFAVSPDARLLAYSMDDDGSERFKLIVRDLGTGKDIVTIASNSLGQPAWSSDGKSLLWVEASEQWRPFRVRRHVLGGATGNDPTLYEEKDSSFFVGLDLSQDRRWFLVSAADHVTSEIRLIPAGDPGATPLVVSPRKTGREYAVDVRGDTLFIRTNDTHRNFRVATASIANPGEWADLIPGSDRHYIRGITAFASYLAITERLDGLDQIRLRMPDNSDRYVKLPEASYTVSLSTNAEADAPLLRLSYSSMVTPTTVYDYDVAKDALVTRKVQEIPSGYNAADYATERLMARARDGVMVPVSVVYKKGYRKDGSQPLHVYGYGAYGLAVPPSFSTSVLSLLDRGFAYAIAHIRGGDDLGYQWYLDGKLMKRTNTFNDFVDVTRFLNSQGFSREGRNSASGGSAGGSLMGAIVNSDPGLWRAIAAHVPFVDVLNTMLDTSLPLTPIEWPEWGNPKTDEAAFRTILSYSPYDNLKRQAYPAMLVTAGLNDPRVTYWEPAKWVARLRATKTDRNPLLLKTNMGAGHGGKSGRFERLRETAEEYAFILAQFDTAR